MGKLIVISLDESEKDIYNQILKIVNEADISIERKLDESQRDIQVGGLNIMPGQHKVLKQGREITLTADTIGMLKLKYCTRIKK